MTEIMPVLPLWVDVTAMSTTALYGAATARSRNVPISGTLFAGILCGAAGGMVRDLLLGLEPVAITGPYYLPWILFATVIGAFLFYRFISKKIPYLVLRGIAIGLLIAIGCQKALIHDVPFVSIILCGVLTATVGGMALDALTGHRSAVFSQAHWFATALIIGSLVFYGLTVTTNFYIATLIAVLVTASLYVLSVIRNWPSPKWPNESDDTSSS
jgi:uncharacterized membrane protein YeiH